MRVGASIKGESLVFLWLVRVVLYVGEKSLLHNLLCEFRITYDALPYVRYFEWLGKWST